VSAVVGESPGRLARDTQGPSATDVDGGDEEDGAVEDLHDVAPADAIISLTALSLASASTGTGSIEAPQNGQ